VRRSVKIKEFRKGDESPSVFCDLVGHVPEIAPDEISVCLVRNVADSLNPSSEYCVRELGGVPRPYDPKGPYGGGKPEGIGMPGGGRNDDEGIEEAGYREVLAESGIKIPSFGMELVDKYKKFILQDTKNKTQKVFWVSFGTTPPGIEVREGTGNVVQNPFYVFLAKFAWDDMPLKKIFCQRLQDGYRYGDLHPDVVRKEGLIVRFFTASKEERENLRSTLLPVEDVANELGVVELNEISAIGVFPYSHIFDKLTDSEGWYFSHVALLCKHYQTACKKLGVEPNQELVGRFEQWRQEELKKDDVLPFLKY